MSAKPSPPDPGAERPAAVTRGLRTPDVEELRTLCAAAELGSLGRAAVRLHASQPALSKRLANLEALTGTRLLERSPHGVKLTPAGRRLYPEARRLLEQSERVREVIAGIAASEGPIRLAASHSATDALVGELLGHLNEHRAIAIELVSANSTTVRDLVADGRADIGVAASRPGHTPYPGVRELTLAADEVICAVPPGHRWTRRRRISIQEFLAVPMVMRDPSSNARWTVDSVLRERGLVAAPPLVEAGTPSAARREALARRAPVLLARSVLDGHDFTEVPIDGLSFPREYVIVLPAVGEPPEEIRALIDHLRRQVRIWLRNRPLSAPSPAAITFPTDRHDNGEGPPPAER
ncbi:MAG TPA: LysR family transcriptional regulator [Solirubrobacteraceae bacterium]|nr:LysR family transcriptional regulator [Solirubrobacteraceae bacterium]